ncbi:MAG: hypothetical protein WA942_18985 [Mycolicibacter sinensis]
MNEDTWTNRDLPVLRAAVRLSDESDMPVSATAIGRVVGFDEETTQRALRALYRMPYFGPAHVGDDVIQFIGSPTDEALRVAGQWPSPENLAERLVAAYRAAGQDNMLSVPQREWFKRTADEIESDSPAAQTTIRAFGGYGGKIIS